MTLTVPAVLFPNVTSTIWFDGKDLWGPQPAKAAVDNAAKQTAVDNAKKLFMLILNVEFNSIYFIILIVAAFITASQGKTYFWL
jgi:hypothetical protein